MISSWLHQFNQRWELYKTRRLLKLQESLAKRGIGLRTEVLDIIEKKSILDGYVELYFKARLRINGKISCRQVHTLLRWENIPGKGDTVHIRYKQGHPRLVLLLHGN